MWTFTAARARAVLWLSLIILWSSSSPAAELFTKMGTGAFLGRMHFAFGYELADNHDFSVGLGRTYALRGISVHQINLEYRYNALKNFETKWPGWSWHPLQLYLAASYATNHEFFLDSPPQYPEDEYYEPTAYSGFIGLGTEMELPFFEKQVALYYWINTTSHYLLAKYNNSKWHSEFCCSAGFGLKVGLDQFDQ